MNKNILFFTLLLAVGINLNMHSCECRGGRKDPYLRLAKGMAVGIAGFIAFHAIADNVRSIKEDRTEAERKKAVLKEAEERLAKGGSPSALPIED